MCLKTCFERTLKFKGTEQKAHKNLLKSLKRNIRIFKMQSVFCGLACDHQYFRSGCGACPVEQLCSKKKTKQGVFSHCHLPQAAKTRAYYGTYLYIYSAKSIHYSSLLFQFLLQVHTQVINSPSLQEGNTAVNNTIALQQSLKSTEVAESPTPYIFFIISNAPFNFSLLRNESPQKH